MLRATKAVARWTFALAVVTALTVIVLFFSLRISQSTDKTLRAGQRAFVYISGLSDESTGNGNWIFVPKSINNGTTQTVDMEYNLACEYGLSNSVSKSVQDFLGPKQENGLGACIWSIDRLTEAWANGWFLKLKLYVFYKDVFKVSHLTRVCRNIKISNDPRNQRQLVYIASRCPELPDCADNECFSEPAHAP